MSNWIAIATRTLPCLFAAFLAGTSSGQGFLQMGLDAVGWEANNATGPLLYREVPESQFTSVRAKISGQSTGMWSLAGPMVRAPNAGAGENWQTSWSFRPGANDLRHQSNRVLDGVEEELNDAGLTVGQLMYVRLDNLGGGVFQAFRGSGPDDNNITWTPQMDAMMMPQPQTNPNLVGQTLQVGLAGGAIGALAGASVAFDWVEIQTTGQTFRDDFTTAHDYTTGVPAGGIWTGVENAAAGGVSTRAGNDVGRCLQCTWNIAGSGNFNLANNWAPAILFPPSGNNVSVTFGAALTAANVTVYNDTNVTLKELRFDTTSTLALAGAGSISLEADSGNALINVLQGSPEIQVDLVLNDDVTATAAAGTTLNINTPVYLNGHTFTVSAGSTVNLNDGTVIGGAAGAGQLLNAGNLSGLGGVAGDLIQSSSGILAVDLGGTPVQIAGDAALGGVLDVSLHDGFVPAGGTLYPVLTAGSVTDMGLSLGGADAGLFRLVVGADSVSLLAAAIPEPSTVTLVTIGLAAIGLSRRRPAFARACASRTISSESKFGSLGVVLIAISKPLSRSLTGTGRGVIVAAIAASSAWAQTVVEVRRDDFGNTATPHAQQHDYTTGTVPVGGIWNGIHNPTNGGDATTPALFVADGTAFDGTDKAGKLHVEDLAFHVNSNGALGVGWEPQGDKNNAPFLFTTFSGTPQAQYDFDAVVKIDAQTAGNWSHAGIIARVAGPPVGICCGQDEANSFATTGPDAESFVTAGTFRDNAANPDNATLLIQNTLNGAVGAGDIAVDLAPAGAVGGGATTPIWLRLQKRGAQFTADSSLDGVTWFDDPATNNSTVNEALNVPGRTLEVGLGFMMYPTAPSGGNADFDFFELTLYESQIPTSATWNVAASGNWNTPANWLSVPPGTVPNHNTIEVTFGPAATAPTTVFSNTPVIAKALRFDNTNKFAVGGTGSLTLTSDSGASTINVDRGSHEIQLDLVLANPTTINAAAGARLEINNTLDFTSTTAANRSLTVTGAGRVDINNNIDLPVTGAVVTVNGGHLGGNGRVNGRLTNTGGTVSPGTSVGTLTIDGNYQQNAAGTLAIELAGTAAGQFDRLQVIGPLNGAILDGLLDVSLVNGFTPAVGNTFDVLTAEGGINNAGVISLHASDSSFYSLAVMGGTTLRLTVTAVPMQGLTGDYNSDGTVDAADYVAWRDAMTSGAVLPNDSTPGTVDQADYTAWRANFGRASGSGSAAAVAAVPEPASSVMLLMMAATGWCAARRR
jgi:hypothetical protein